MAVFSRHAVLDWTGDLTQGSGTIAAGTQAFTAGASYPRVVGEPAGMTTPEELLAASHAVCYGIGLRSVLARSGGRARRVVVTATVTAEKTGEGIRVLRSHLDARVEALEGIGPERLDDIGRTTEAGCTISNAIRAAVAITFAVRAV